VWPSIYRRAIYKSGYTPWNLSKKGRRAAPKTEKVVYATFHPGT
jgi:hypothetical protein